MLLVREAFCSPTTCTLEPHAAASKPWRSSQSRPSVLSSAALACRRSQARRLVALAASAPVCGLLLRGKRRGQKRRCICRAALASPVREADCLAPAEGGAEGEGPTASPGGLLVLCGPSGVGKSTLVKQLFGDVKLQGRLAFVVSHTTRAPREGETDGVEYHFVARETMEQMIRNGEFLEHASVHGNFYGTSFASIEEVLESGRICVLDVDLQGVRSLHHQTTTGRLLGSAVRFVLINLSGGLGALEARLRARGSEEEEAIQRRLRTAAQELDEYRTFRWDRTIFNEEGNPEKGADELRSVVGEILAVSGAGNGPATDVSADAGPSAQDGPGAQVAAAAPSVFGEFSGLARQLGSACVDLGQGFPNFDPPDFVVQALLGELTDAGDGGPQTRHQYTRTAGHPSFVQALAKRYSQHFDREVDPMTEVAVTCGATGGLYVSLTAVLNRSGPQAREIVTLEPFFSLYRSQAEALGTVLRTVPMSFDRESHSFAFDEAAAEALEGALGPQTAALIVNTPHNPTGKVFEYHELLAIARIVQKHPHIMVISDEVYKYMIFDPANEGEQDSPWGHHHFATLPGMWARTLTVSSAGKTFGITGWQIGWVIGPSSWVTQIHKFMPNLHFCAGTLMQRALSRVLKAAALPYLDAPDYYTWLRRDYRRRGKVMIEALKSAGISTVRSQGGFFLLGEIRGLCGPAGPFGAKWEEASRPDQAADWTFCRLLATEIGVVSLPCSPFFSQDVDPEVRMRFARFCFAKQLPTLEEASRRLQGLRGGSALGAAAAAAAGG